MSTNIKTQIIEGGKKQFFKYGVKSVTVYDITYALSISKKTFYLHFKNKEELVKIIVKDFIQQIQTVEEKTMERPDIIDKIFTLYSLSLQQFMLCNISFMYDINKYHPKAYNKIKLFLNGEFKDFLILLIREGKAEGVFINDISEDVIFATHLKMFNNIIERELFPDRILADPIYNKIIKLSLIGISTLKGHKIIDEKFKKLK